MGWTIILENEEHKEIVKLSHDFQSGFLHPEEKLEHFRLLKYLDPYCDTTFNKIQMDDLIADLKKLKKEDINNAQIDEILKMAERCKAEAHTYLAFYGD